MTARRGGKLEHDVSLCKQVQSCCVRPTSCPLAAAAAACVQANSPALPVQVKVVRFSREDQKPLSFWGITSIRMALCVG